MEEGWDKKERLRRGALHRRPASCAENQAFKTTQPALPEVPRKQTRCRQGCELSCGRVLTEHSSSEVCTQPDRSLRTQQAECFSRSRAAWMKLCT